MSFGERSPDELSIASSSAGHQLDCMASHSFGSANHSQEEQGQSTISTSQNAYCANDYHDAESRISGYLPDEERRESESTPRMADTSTSCFSNRFTQQPSPDSPWTNYSVLVDPNQDDKAADLALWSTARPHMRAFHMAWISFFVAFFNWFAMTPLLREVARSLDLTREEVWTSSVVAVASSGLTRILWGPVNDAYGARFGMATTLVLSALPTALAGWLVHDLQSLVWIRLCIGVAGSSFVSCQYWTSSMFSVQVAGAANALAAGWGNMAGGVAQVVMGSLLFPLLKLLYSRQNDTIDDDRAADLAWRTALVLPVALCLLMAYAVLRYSDDSPKGPHTRPATSNLSNLLRAGRSVNTFLLLIHYACSFGVEITMIQAAALYFSDEFGMGTESAAAVASIFGWMNLFARGVGGFLSDFANAKAGFRGRLWIQAIVLILEGCLVLLFSAMRSLTGAIFVMVIFSVFVQAAEGSTFGIVPYVDSAVTGSVAGWVAAGGNMGGVAFALLFRGMDDRSAFGWMGGVVLGSATLTALIRIPGHRGLLSGHEDAAIAEHRLRAKLPSSVMVVLVEPVEPLEVDPEIDPSDSPAL